ncbi:MAG: sigma-70 family RNA polymerase sigma factor [Terriglobales bacterium]|jgi:RNA polymerase sigma-70 factor (ECF subfamily)
MLMQFHDFDGPYLDRLRSGDFTTEQHFFSYFGELIRLKFGRRLRSSIAIEDVRQETFTRVLRGLSEQRIRQPERLGAFVNAVCTNVVREQYRSACREIPTADGFADGVPDPRLCPSDAMYQRQVQQEVRQTLDELPKRDRRILKALFLEERDKDEVCRDFGIDRNYLRVMIHRAKQSFKECYMKRMEKVRAASAYMMSSKTRRRTKRKKTLALIDAQALAQN